MPLPLPHLPVGESLPAIAAALAAKNRAILSAPPGAGKTTRVPLYLMDRTAGRILMLEPRRIAARAAAERMAATLAAALAAEAGHAETLPDGSAL